MKQLLLVLISLQCFLSCRNHEKDMVFSENPSDSLVNSKYEVENKNNTPLEAELESWRFFSLKTALEVAAVNIDSSEFFLNLEKEDMRNNENNRKNELRIGYFFTPLKKHVIISRHDHYTAYRDIFEIVDGDIQEVLSYKQNILSEVDDTIQDINGDGIKDYRINWYPSSGCCMGNISTVYLYDNREEHFSERFEFENATFFPDEKSLIGIAYGTLGQVPLYKYSWNGFTLDTIEYISCERDDTGNRTGKLILKKVNNDSEPLSDEIIIDQIPMEYRNLSGIDWFKGIMN